ncbi:hypothetical protein [Streptococcus mutans]|nr:hypothetical protein [Streptococcus mutans]MCY7129255.1 hypothetical protein [Streptococcus mutans]OVF00326.1 hypothetical protein CAV53_05880 [Streptococcus mutans]
MMKNLCCWHAYEQTRFVLQSIMDLFAKEELPFENLYRTRLFVTDIS